MRRALFMVGLVAALPAWAAPRHIMSLNLCADQLVLALAPSGRVASVSYLARDCQVSVACEAAAQLPINYGTAEEMVATDPDLMIAGRYTNRATVALAHRFGKQVLDLDVPNTFEEVRDQILEVADAVGAHDQGVAMIDRFDRDLAALPVGKEPRPVAAVYETNGFSVGKGTLIDTIITRAGLDNLAASLHIDNYPVLPLEVLVADQPGLLIIDAKPETRPSLGGAMLNHPILVDGFPGDRRTVVPQKLWLCGTPSIVDAIHLLIQARERIEAAHS